MNNCEVKRLIDNELRLSLLLCGRRLLRVSPNASCDGPIRYALYVGFSCKTARNINSSYFNIIYRKSDPANSTARLQPSQTQPIPCTSRQCYTIAFIVCRLNVATLESIKFVTQQHFPNIQN